MKNDKELTLEQLNELIEADPANHILYLERGILKSNAGDKRGALTDFNESIELNPGYAKAYYMRAYTFKSIGENQKALKDFNEVIRLNPANSKSYIARGKVKALLGDDSGAEADYNTAKVLGSKTIDGNASRNSEVSDYDLPPSSSNIRNSFSPHDSRKENTRATTPISETNSKRKTTQSPQSNSTAKSNTLQIGVIAVVSIFIVVLIYIQFFSKKTSDKEDINLSKSEKTTQSQNSQNEQVRPNNRSNVPEMVFVEGGSFEMGSNSGTDEERPVHTVTVSSFYISKYEVTVREYRAFCYATGKVMAKEPAWGWNENDPIVNISWPDAGAYCQWAAGRLPTEAEWEYAARGGNKSRGYRYSGSNNIDDVAWFQSNSSGRSHEVGLKGANELGIYDMSGNAWEWCSDWYGRNYYSDSQTRDPMGLAGGEYRVIRGGYWGVNSDFCKSTYRKRDFAVFPNGYLGIRLVKNNR